MHVKSLEVMLTGGQKITLGSGLFIADSDGIRHYHTEKIGDNCVTCDTTIILNKEIMSYSYTTEIYD